MDIDKWLHCSGNKWERSFGSAFDTWRDDWIRGSFQIRVGIGYLQAVIAIDYQSAHSFLESESVSSQSNFIVDGINSLQSLNQSKSHATLGINHY